MGKLHVKEKQAFLTDAEETRAFVDVCSKAIMKRKIFTADIAIDEVRTFVIRANSFDEAHASALIITQDLLENTSTRQSLISVVNTELRIVKEM